MMKEDPKSKSSFPNAFAEPELRQQTIPRQATGDVTPLSFGQQRMWFHQQLEPRSPLYNTYRTWRVRGALNVEALESACKLLLHVTGSCVRLFIIQNRYILTTRNELIWGQWQALSENRVRYNRPLQNWSSALKLLHCPRETMSPSQPKSPAPIALLPEDRAVAFGNPIDSGDSRGPSYHRWVLPE